MQARKGHVGRRVKTEVVRTVCWVDMSCPLGSASSRE